LPPLTRVKISAKKTHAKEIPRKRPITRPATEKAGARAAASDTLPADGKSGFIGSICVHWQ